MKKKLVSIALLTTMIFTGCGTATDDSGQDNITVTDNRTNTESEQGTSAITVNDNRQSSSESEKITVSASDFETTGYMYEDSLGTTYCYLTVKNNSSVPVGISGNGIAKDADGNSIGAGNMSIDILGAGETSIGYFYFYDVENIAQVDYSLNYDTSPNYYPVIGNLDVEQTLNDKNVTVSITNNGEYPAQFVQAYCLFFDENDNVLRADWTYATDGDSEIKPNATISVQLDNYSEGYDHAQVFFTGRGTGESSWVAKSNETANVTDSDFSVVEYIYENSIGDTSCYLAITNNSSEIVEINGNGTARDSNGNILGADDLSIDVLAPGETSIDYFYFNDVTGVASVDYNLSYTIEKYYSPIISDLTAEESINNQNVILSVTNNGATAAKFVQAYAIFLDSAGNVIDVDWNYITDDDSEIKSGSTLSTQLNCNKSFDHVDVYFTGRGSN